MLKSENFSGPEGVVVFVNEMDIDKENIQAIVYDGEYWELFWWEYKLERG